MKLIKKIIRLLPIFSILAPFLAFFFNKGVFNGLTSINELHNYIDAFYTSCLTNFYEPILRLLYAPPFTNLFTWWRDFTGNNDFLNLAFCIMCYELLISLLFIMFDFLNMIFDWANKFIKKGRNLDD